MCANGPLKQEENQKAICTIYSELQLMSLALYTPVTHTYTQFTASVSTCMPLSPSMLAALAISKVWWVLVTT